MKNSVSNHDEARACVRCRKSRQAESARCHLYRKLSLLSRSMSRGHLVYYPTPFFQWRKRSLGEDGQKTKRWSEVSKISIVGSVSLHCRVDH
jgi:hypothetical protein